MDGLVMGLLGSLGFVFGLTFAFFLMYRRHLRRLHRDDQEQFRRVAKSAIPRRRPPAYPLPARWLAIRSANSVSVRDTLPAPSPVVPWSEALARSRERAWFVSPPVDGWTLVVGSRLPDVAQDVDRVYRFLAQLSRELGEVHFYSADRVLSFHAWAQWDHGRVVRAYAWAGETVWNEGRPTAEERLLGLRCREYGEIPEAARYGEIPPEVHNTERVGLLARRWSLDLAAASEILLQHEAVESEDDDEARE
jgi:hypothetical protein